MSRSTKSQVFIEFEMQQFVPASALKQVFGVYGHFYSVELASKEIVECRSCLEIADKDQVKGDLVELSVRKPDAVFIMMNPGSSKPLVEVNNRVRAAMIGKLKVSLVPTRPDTTQYQVMRLMQLRDWRHVRVLNLSDLRCAKSPEFIKRFQRLEREEDYDAHSIFSAARAEELAIKLPASKKMPLVFAWGLSNQLNPLIERCLARLDSKRTTFGLLAKDTVNKYRHPLPTLERDKREWLANIAKQFNG